MVFKWKKLVKLIFMKIFFSVPIMTSLIDADNTFGVSRPNSFSKESKKFVIASSISDNLQDLAFD